MSTQLSETTLVTGNRHKLDEARRILGLQLNAVDIDLPEIQSMDLLTVLESKADAAARRLEGPLIVEESSFRLCALNGFPGPLIKWMLQSIGAPAIALLAQELGDTEATAECALLYRDSARQVVARGEVQGNLTLPPRGSNGFGWDPVFVAAGEMRTFGELADAEKDLISHRGRAWQDLSGKLSS
jgi:non-canonical purine NTP pyrophosphatase (RdgB/HAM1 family)